MINIPILDDAKQPTTDFVHGRPLVRVNAWINGDRVLKDGFGLIDTGARHSAIGHTKIGNNVPDQHLPSEHGGGSGMAGVFRFAELQIENFRSVPVTISLFPGTQFDVLIGRDVLQYCHLVMDHRNRIYTLDMA